MYLSQFCKTPLLQSFCNSIVSCCLRTLPANNYSQFPPSYVKPVFHPDDIKKLEPEEVRELLHQKILPPRSDDNSSIFYDALIEKFVNRVMRHGRKEKSREIIRKTFVKIKAMQVRKYNLETDPEIKEKIPTDPIEIFHRAFENCKPLLDVTHVKRGGTVYKVPIHIEDRRANFLAFKWLIEAAREKPRRTSFSQRPDAMFHDKLAKELIDALDHNGKAMKRKLELHKLCEANKAYAHYRWT